MISLAMAGARKRNPTCDREKKTKFFTPLYLDIANNCVISHYRSRRRVRGWAMTFWKRRLLDALVLTIENFATSKVCQKQSNGECLMGSFSYSFVILIVMIGMM